MALGSRLIEKDITQRHEGTEDWKFIVDFICFFDKIVVMLIDS